MIFSPSVNLFLCTLESMSLTKARIGLVFAGPGTPATGPVYRDVVGSGTAGRTLSTYNAFPVCVPSHTKDIWLAVN